jgi:hypothetical protein
MFGSEVLRDPNVARSLVEIARPSGAAATAEGQCSSMPGGLV